MRKANVMLSSIICVATFAWAGSAFALNPQPEPPMQRLKDLKLQNMQTQPSDPCLASHTATMDKHLSESARTGQLNAAALACAHKSFGPGPQQLNPQPLPPG